MVVRAVSQSQINLYRSCPYAYFLQYHLKKQPIMYDPSIMEVGRRVHDAIDAYYKGCYSNETGEENILAETYGILRSEWDTTLPANYLKKAHTCIVNFAKWEANNIGHLATKPITEIKIYSGDLMGVVDYLDLNKPKAVDFKTNTRAMLNHDYKMQAVMYKLLIKNKFAIDINNFSFLFLFTGETKDVYVNGGTLLEIEKELIMYKDKILESWKTMNFPKQPRTSCKGCAFKYYCGGVDGNSN